MTGGNPLALEDAIILHPTELSGRPPFIADLLEPLLAAARVVAAGRHASVRRVPGVLIWRLPADHEETPGGSVARLVRTSAGTGLSRIEWILRQEDEQAIARVIVVDHASPATDDGAIVAEMLRLVALGIDGARHVVREDPAALDAERDRLKRLSRTMMREAVASIIPTAIGTTDDPTTGRAPVTVVHRLAAPWLIASADGCVGAAAMADVPRRAGFPVVVACEPKSGRFRDPPTVFLTHMRFEHHGLERAEDAMTRLRLVAELDDACPPDGRRSAT